MVDVCWKIISTFSYVCFIGIFERMMFPKGNVFLKTSKIVLRKHKYFMVGPTLAMLVLMHLNFSISQRDFLV